MGRFMTYNFCLEDKNFSNNPTSIKRVLVDSRNNIETNFLIPGVQSYLNYLNLLMLMRDKWYSTAYLDLGMIPIIVAPSFMQEALVNSILPNFSKTGLNIYPLPSSSFLSRNGYKGVAEYWAFRSDLAEYLNCDPLEVTTKKVMSDVMGVDYE